jgi:transcription-repair coupling factor (superfamily II helicase)
LLEEAVRQLKNELKPARPDAHVDIGISAFIPKTYIPGDRQRMDIYRRLTRCSDLTMLSELKQDMEDAFGEAPRQVLVLFALTQLRLLAGLYGIDSVIRQGPDIVLTVRDASKAQHALIGAPGTLRVIDDKTVYLRMPPTFMEPEACLMVLRNLMNAAHERDVKGEPPPAPKAPPPPTKKPVVVKGRT